MITTLREEAGEQVPRLVREAGRTFPAGLAALDAWTPPWSGAGAAAGGRPAVGAGAPGTGSAAGLGTGGTGPVAELLAGHPESCDAVAGLLGCDDGWRSLSAPTATSGEAELLELLARHPEPAEALAARL
jgi:hypothetical protein